MNAPATNPVVEQLRKVCMWCDNIALYECDAVIGMKAEIAPAVVRKGKVVQGPRIVYAPLEQQEVWTCDALLCLLHRRVAGFYCGEKDSAGTIDRCPYCAEHDPRGAPMTKEDADRIRRERHAEIRRSQMRRAK